MLAFTTADVVAVLKKSNNLNAALKSYLKKEVKPGDPSARFVKDLREILERPNTFGLETYIEKSKGRFETQLIGIGSYAHSLTISNIVNKIADRYADEFNGTYELLDQKIEIKDQAKFDSIAKQALAIIDQDLKEAGFADSAFMKNSVMLTIFDPRVLAVIL